MVRRKHHPILPLAALFSLTLACTLTQTPSGAGPFDDQVQTSVVMTLTARPTNPPANTPVPTLTVFVPPAPTATLPSTLTPTTAPTPRPDYACDVTDQWPLDDVVFKRGEPFDLKWTLVNTGTQRWENGTYLEYLRGPEMTDVFSLELPRLRPGEEYDVILDAIAPDELDRQVMVWAVYVPLQDADYVMCYPYVRMIVER